MSTTAVAGLCVVLGGGSLTMGSVLVYSNDFEGAVGSEWSTTGIATTPTGRQFLGKDATYGFSNDTVTLTVDLPADTTHASVTFDVYVNRVLERLRPATGAGPVLLQCAGG